MADSTPPTALSSMTGFATTTATTQGWSWTVEMRSVNGRGLDLRFRLPDWIDGLEPALRKTLQARLGRGNVTIGVRMQRDQGAAGASLNEDALDNLLKIIHKIDSGAHERGVKLRKSSAADIAGIKGVLDAAEAPVDDLDALRAAVIESAETCLDAFIADRDREGRAIAAVIAGQIDRLEALTADARTAAGDRETEARAALDRALARLLDATEVPDEARLLQEMALVAVKNDITEELDRLSAHIDAARDLLGQAGAVGRKFDFLMQEFNREANTLCSKSQSTALTAIGLDLKALIDQMREQVQNIE